MIIPDDSNYLAMAFLAGKPFTNQDIRDTELERARHALTYLKQKIGTEAMRELLQDDLAAMTDQVRGWVEASDGAWQTGSVDLIVPGPRAEVFHAWYTRAITNSRERELREGHPEHFVSHPRRHDIEVVENIGETELPWRIFYHSLPEKRARSRPCGTPDYPVRFGAEILDADGFRVGFTMHQSRDAEDGMHLKLTTFLPSAAPREIVERHLHQLYNRV